VERRSRNILSRGLEGHAYIEIFQGLAKEERMVMTESAIISKRSDYDRKERNDIRADQTRHRSLLEELSKGAKIKDARITSHSEGPRGCLMQRQSYSRKGGELENSTSRGIGEKVDFRRDIEGVKEKKNKNSGRKGERVLTGESSKSSLGNMNLIQLGRAVQANWEAMNHDRRSARHVSPRTFYQTPQGLISAFLKKQTE